MEINKLVSRLVLLPFNAAATSAEMMAQSTRSVQKMAEKSLDSMMGRSDECDDCGKDDDDDSE